MTTAWNARGQQRDEAGKAAETAERLRQELTRARVELEFLERARSRPSDQILVDGRPRPAIAELSLVLAERAPESPAPEPTPRPLRGRSHGLAVGIWLVVFYLLLAVLATAGDGAPGSTGQPAVVPGVSTTVVTGG